MRKEGFYKCIYYNEDEKDKDSLIFKYNGSFNGFIEKFVKLMVDNAYLWFYCQRFYITKEGYEICFFKKVEDMEYTLDRTYGLNVMNLDSLIVNGKFFCGNRLYTEEKVVVNGKEYLGFKINPKEEEYSDLLTILLSNITYTRKNNKVYIWSLVCGDSYFGRNSECVYIIPIERRCFR